MKRKALGKGLRSLIPEAPPRAKPLTPAPTGGLRMLDLDRSSPNPDQPRAEFDEAAAPSLRAFSMLEVGRAFLGRALGRTPERALVEEFVGAYLAEWNQGVDYLEGIQELLERLARRYTLSIVTNTHQPDLVPGHLGKMGVSRRFRTVVTSVEFGYRKPYPGIFAHALDRLAAKSEECVYVGDDFEADYRGARSAGIEALLIDPTGRASVPEADRLRSIFELEARLA